MNRPATTRWPGSDQDPAAFLVQEMGIPLAEAKILAALAGRFGQIVGKEMLAIALWGQPVDGAPDPQVIESHVSKLRKKLPAGCSIKTHRFLGYQLTGDRAALPDMPQAPMSILLNQRQAELLGREAGRRACSPAHLATRILQTVLADWELLDQLEVEL